jgi:glutamate--cysteine ligase catalytic subunit
MGLLVVGTPLNWVASKKHHVHVKKHGVIQFLNIWKALKEKKWSQFLWGDEVESMLITVDHDQKVARICLRAAEVLAQLEAASKLLSERDPKFVFNAHFVPEYGSFMVEATPARPYGGFTTDLRLVEANMRLRRQLVSTLLGPNERMMTITAFGMMGTPDCIAGGPYVAPGPVYDSLYLPDVVIGAHPRFTTLTQNIRNRRGSKVCIKIPLFQDKHTISAAKRTGQDVVFEAGPNPDEVIDPTKTIHMDAMGFGMGCCCLQVTFQASSLVEARTLYDHLAVLSPILLALTAATPFLRGKIADTDVRWGVISQACDDRTPVERGVVEGEEGGAGRINKPRYDSIDCYISGEEPNLDKYNDINCLTDKETYDTLIKEGVDPRLAQHIAHLYIRDPLVIYEEKVDMDDEKSTDHFENIQSTNWQTVRFKPPPPNSPIGWRVEFRTMEVQLTDFENAAFTVFIALLARAILLFKLNLYIPISKVDENVKTAHKNDAVRRERFFFRLGIHGKKSAEDEYDQMSIEDIMCGTGKFEGLIPLVEAYLSLIKCDKNTLLVVGGYLDLIRRRARGELLTQAQWLRRYVQNHPSYQQDSTISPALYYNIIETCNQISQGNLRVPHLLGEHGAKPGARREVSFSGLGSPLRGASFSKDFDDPEAFAAQYTQELQAHAAFTAVHK